MSSFASNTLTRISATALGGPAPVPTASSAHAIDRALGRAGTVVATIPVPSGGGPFTAGEGAV